MIIGKNIGRFITKRKNININLKDKMGNTTDPQFISNLPCGEDCTEGKAQQHLTDAITKYITSSDSKDKTTVPRIIGLKGEWGTGKSNVIKQLRKSLKDKYCVFEYDAWGHQEDLQRRSFLETLTGDLLNNKEYDDYLSKGKKVVISWERKDEKITWEDKLDELLAHKRITKTNSIPEFNGGAFWTALFLSLTPITTFVAERLVDQSVKCIPVLVLIAFSPILLGLLVWGIAWCCNKEARHWGYLLKISKDGYTSEKNYEIINEEEPSVAKFCRWMQDLSKYISEYKKPRLVIVYDNMDRLPADKVKELWSSIHTFFAENGFENIWVIIPFDEKHLSQAYREANDVDNELLLIKQFISKTFPVVYRVTPPIITDYQVIFDKLYSNAFEKTEEKEKEKTYHIFRYVKPNATVREIIEFINSLVALKQIWHNDIELSHCAIFILKETEITKDPVDKILSGLYIDNYIKNIIPNDEILQKNIAALFYGVKPEFAEQIPMCKFIQSCFDDHSNNNINKYSGAEKFAFVLRKVVLETDVFKTDSVIECLANLNIESFDAMDKDIVVGIWNELLKRKENQKLSEQKFDKSYEILLLHIDDKESIVRPLCKKLQEFNEAPENPFNGANYYNALKEIQKIISNNKFDIEITQYLKEIERNAKIFVNYVKVAKEDYKTYKLSTNNDELNSYLSELKDVKRIEDLSILQYVKDDQKYDFEVLGKAIEIFNQSDGIDEINFKEILDAYKIISKERPLRIQLTQERRNRIWNFWNNRLAEKKYLKNFSDNEKNAYLEILAIQLAKNENISIKLDDEKIGYIAAQMNCYANYQDLLLSRNNGLIKSVLKYMVENHIGGHVSLSTVLPNFFEIKNNIGVTEDSLLDQLNTYGSVNDITQENIQRIVPKELYSFTKETSNDLTKNINKFASQALFAIDENTLYDQFNSSDSYWYKITDCLIETEFFEPLPDNIFNIGTRYLKDVATNGIIPKDNSIQEKIISRLDRSRMGGTVVKIRNMFCNSEIRINEQNFLYLERWLREKGELKSRAKDVVYNIIDPVVENVDCLMLISGNADFYVDLFSVVGEDSTPTKEKIQKFINKYNENQQIIEFAKRIE